MIIAAYFGCMGLLPLLRLIIVKRIVKGCSACEASLGKDVSQMQNRSRDVFMPNTTDLANLRLLYDNFTGIESRTILLCGMLQGCTDENMFARFQEQLESATNFAYQNFSKAIDLYYFVSSGVFFIS